MFGVSQVEVTGFAVVFTACLFSKEKEEKETLRSPCVGVLRTETLRVQSDHVSGVFSLPVLLSTTFFVFYFYHSHRGRLLTTAGCLSNR